MSLRTNRSNPITGSWMLLMLFAAPAFAQLPDTDIWLLKASWKSDTLSVSEPVNITDRPGYDNQPAFSPDGKYILYTSIREHRSDIYKYDIATRTISQFTYTPNTAEYSPAFMEKGKGISVVIVEADDSTQRIWKFPMKGGSKATPVLPKFDSIGYHCWYDYGNRIVVFLLTEPSSLQMIDKHYDRPKFIADSVGRCMKMDGSLLYYTVKTNGRNDVWWFNLPGWHTEFSGITIGSEDFAMYERTFIYGWGSKLSVATLDHSIHRAIGDLGEMGIRNISRVAISRDGTQIAIVAEK